MRLTHTIDSLKLYAFLEKYPNRWHTYGTDKKTLKALERVKILYPLVVTNEFNQMKLEIIEE